MLLELPVVCFSIFSSNSTAFDALQIDKSPTLILVNATGMCFTVMRAPLDFNDSS